MEDSSAAHKTCYLASIDLGSSLWSCCFRKLLIGLWRMLLNLLLACLCPAHFLLVTRRRLMITMTERSMQLMSLIVQFHQGLFLRMRLLPKSGCCFWEALAWLVYWMCGQGHDFPVVFYLALGGSLLSYIYSAPPLKLKQNGWIGNFALGASYISLPWWAGQALFGTLTPDIIVLTLLYSIAGLGIAIVNDFKSIEGDRALGLQSLPVAFGAETAKWICVGAIDITQLSVAGYLLEAGKPYYALALVGLIIPQVVFQFQYFLKDPVKYDVKYQASAQPFLVLGLLVTALATSH
ncbi:CHLOROPHYLL SYNTHASE CHLOROPLASTIC [Salix koriyanagi]|uniref:CHLOROPHYLL SYNTHASE CHLOROPLASTIC n=1 Tax=Salix koriyanagi TaxID=2511006 RepID=A0A9Q0VEJ0_9ROSI|nr:CHLOROPHYLL SYNTHASE CHLOROPLASTIC [Salix koriyanagi]